MLILNRKYIICAVTLLLIEIFIGFFVHDHFIRPYLGDFLVVILIYCFVKSFLNISVLRAAIYVLIFSYLVETLQYFKIADLLGFQKGSLLYIIAGNSFSWADIAAYTIGIAITVIIELLLGNAG